MFPATTAAAALANFGDLLGDAELLATMFADGFLLVAPINVGFEFCCFAGDDEGVDAREKRFIPEIEDLCCCTDTVEFFEVVVSCCTLYALVLVGVFSLILLSADGEGKLVSLLKVLADELSQLIPEPTDLPLLKPLELDVLFPSPLIWDCLFPICRPVFG